MAIASLDDSLAGRRLVESIYKVGGTMEAAGVPHSHWYSTGRPGAGAAPASGINGGGLIAPVAGQIPRTNPAGGANAYLKHLRLGASQPCSLLLCDRLWANSGLSVTSTTAQAITASGIPARSALGDANGEGVLAAIEWSAAGGSGTPTVTLTYTDQDGNAGATASLVGNATPAAGTFEMFPLAAGDTGIRTPTSFIQNATRTSGTMHLVLFRILAQLSIPGAGMGDAIDEILGGLPELFDDSVPFLVQIPNATTATNLFGTYQETQG